MARCEVCGTESGQFSSHFECDEKVKGGQPPESVREDRRAKVRKDERGQFLSACQASLNFAGIAIIVYAVIGAAIGYRLTREDIINYVLAGVGAIMGALLGSAQYWRQKLRVVEAERMDHYISGEKDLL